MSNITINKIGLQQLHQLQQIGKQTFLETFASFNSEEDMNSYLKDSFSFDKLKEELEEENSEFYFAVLENMPIGYLKVNFENAQTELKDKISIEIERIYVLKEFHGKNIGQLLFEKAIEIAHHRSSKFVWLGVWENNTKAINFYKKNGFVEFDKHIFVLGKDEQTDLMMKLELQ